MPSAREIHTLKPFDVPVLDNLTLNTMRAPPDRSDDYGDENSSDEETVVPSRQAECADVQLSRLGECRERRGVREVMSGLLLKWGLEKLRKVSANGSST